MLIDQTLMRRMNLPYAVMRELSSRNRLLPRRWDDMALAPQSDSVETWLRSQLRRGPSGRSASVVLADKGWHGARPLHVMSLEDRVLYRAIVDLVSKSLPESLRDRAPIDAFRQAPLDTDGAEYVSKTDVTAYYEFVDHDLLCGELTAQTGEALAIDALADVLESVLGRRVGLPQVHPASDILGDTYIDPVRRRLLRQGHTVFTYSDDFRIASTSLGGARTALEACEMEVRAFGLVLNERKTYTYGAENYRRSLTSFTDAEQRLFAGDDVFEGFDGLALLESDYDETNDDDIGAFSLGADVDNGAVDVENKDRINEVEPRLLRAAERAWDLWSSRDESEQIQDNQDAAIAQYLVGKALPALGAGNDRRPLDTLPGLLRFAPALTPQIVSYMEAYGANGRYARRDLRSALDRVVSDDILSTWQGIWLAHAAGGVPPAQSEQNYETWLAKCVTNGHDGLAATAAAAMGRIGRGAPGHVAASVERLGQAWRRLAFRGLIALDRASAENTADDELDRLLLAAGVET